MKVTDALLGEHGAFNALLNGIEKLAATAGDIAQIESASAVLAAELSAHATFEEDLLFPMLEPRLESSEIIDQMRIEHKIIQDGLERIEDARDIGEALEAVAQTMNAARNHFQKEETVLYPLAQKVLDDETLDQLGESWAKARSVTIK